MQFQVPQFIEVEDKIFGPLTFKQFIYVLGGAGACYLLWRTLPLIVAAPFIVVVAGSAAALAFMQYNGRPFILAVESGFNFLTHTKLYLWSNQRKKQKAEEKKVAARPESLYIPKLSESKLHDLAWSLDINERIAAGVATEEERRSAGGGVISSVRTARDALVK